MKTQCDLITDEQTLSGAKGRFGHAIPVYDSGFGPLFILQDSRGIQGIVRTQTWEEAYEICEDEFFPEADDTVEELRREYNFKREHVQMVRRKGATEEREAMAQDYPLGHNEWEFSRWHTKETPCEDENGWTENELFCEAYGFRPNGTNKKGQAGPWHLRQRFKRGIFKFIGPAVN